MMHESPILKPSFGYLSAVYSAEHGYFGGYLVISPLGRPLEFHCTAPVLPSRAQQILYGPTLEPYLLGEKIGSGLIAAAELAPSLILTDFAQFEALKNRLDVPLVLVAGKLPPITVTEPPLQTEQGSDASNPAVEELSAGHPAWCRPFYAVHHWLQLPIGMQSQCDEVAALLATLAQRVELTEPFQRIHEAIREAQRIGVRGTEPHGQAA
jgi:hypothetical protein